MDYTNIYLLTTENNHKRNFKEKVAFRRSQSIYVEHYFAMKYRGMFCRSIKSFLCRTINRKADRIGNTTTDATVTVQLYNPADATVIRQLKGQAM